MDDGRLDFRLAEMSLMQTSELSSAIRSQFRLRRDLLAANNVFRAHGQFESLSKSFRVECLEANKNIQYGKQVKPSGCLLQKHDVALFKVFEVIPSNLRLRVWPSLP